MRHFVTAPKSGWLGSSLGFCVGLSLSLVLACRPEGGGSKHPDGVGVGMDLPVERPTPNLGEAAPLLGVLEAQIAENLSRLADEELDTPAYYLGYDLVDVDELWMESHRGALVRDHIDHDRVLDADVRVGDRQLDNGHIHGGIYGGNGLGTGLSVSMDEGGLSLEQALWLITERQYRDALDAHSEAASSEMLLTREDGPLHPDFSEEKVLQHFEVPVDVDLAAVADRFRPRIAAAAAELAQSEGVLDSAAIFHVRVENHHFVNSEGSRVQSSRLRLRIVLTANAQAEDGMQLERFATFEGHAAEQLPSEAELVAAASELRQELLDLREAPIAEPYTGPAVLSGPAAGVFFHEIFGHRLEGHRQKDDLEGQTFTHMLDKQVLPKFLDVVDDPTVASLGGQPLSGHYFVDDEAVPSQPTQLVEAGKLRGFLLGRSPVLPFETSNGHGRREPGHQVVARQGNLIVTARKTTPEKQLRRALIAEAKRQGKPYGLWFEDIQGGYTITERSGPQAFKVLPLMVYRVWTDGRPDELVRGVDVVGTPLSAFETITAAGDKPGVFNGLCGAESGWVPVSAVSPALLLDKIEVERAVHDRDRPPLLTPPKALRQVGGSR